MKLKNKNDTPIGGFYYDDPITGRPIVTDRNFDNLVRGVHDYYVSRGIQVPDKLAALIEDQICMRQPPDKCFYKGLGDRIAQTIHTAAAAVDKVAGTNLQTTARRCGKCSKRRVNLN